jgi:transposase
VRDALSGDPRTGQAFLFHNARLTHVKLLWHDTTGYRIFYKRLDRGRFRIPLPVPVDARRVEVSPRELAIILESLDTATLRDARRATRAASTLSR